MVNDIHDNRYYINIQLADQEWTVFQLCDVLLHLQGVYLLGYELSRLVELVDDEKSYVYKYLEGTRKLMDSAVVSDIHGSKVSAQENREAHLVIESLHIGSPGRIKFGLDKAGKVVTEIFKKLIFHSEERRRRRIINDLMELKLVKQLIALYEEKTGCSAEFLESRIRVLIDARLRYIQPRIGSYEEALEKLNELYNDGVIDLGNIDLIDEDGSHGED